MKKTTNSFVFGAIALVFTVLGYQTALLVNYAATTRIIADRDCPDNVFSFEGKNSITEDYHNYQNATHFWPHIAAKMMQIIYESDSARQQQMIDSIYMRN